MKQTLSRLRHPIDLEQASVTQPDSSTIDTNLPMQATTSNPSSFLFTKLNLIILLQGIVLLTAIWFHSANIFECILYGIQVVGCLISQKFRSAILMGTMFVGNLLCFVILALYAYFQARKDMWLCIMVSITSLLTLWSCWETCKETLIYTSEALKLVSHTSKRLSSPVVGDANKTD